MSDEKPLTAAEDPMRRLRLAISDPGAFLARGDDYAEPLPSWQARAVIAAIGANPFELTTEVEQLRAGMSHALAEVQSWHGPEAAAILRRLGAVAPELPESDGITRLALTAQRVIAAAWRTGPAQHLETQAAEALESAGMLISPETAEEIRREARAAAWAEATRMLEDSEHLLAADEVREMAADAEAGKVTRAEAEVLELRWSVRDIELGDDGGAVLMLTTAAGAPAALELDAQQVLVLGGDLAERDDDGRRLELPWARWLDEADRSAFLLDLAWAAIRQFTPENSDADTLAAVEQALATHRVIAEADRAQQLAPGDDEEDDEGLAGACDCGEGAVHYTAADCPAERRDAERCKKCRTRFAPDDTRFDGHARYGDTPWCRRCVDRCHESTDFAHACAVCRASDNDTTGGDA